MTTSVATLANEIQNAVNALAAPIRALQTALAEKRAEAFRQAGPAGASDLDANASLDRFRSEVAGALVNAGLGEFLIIDAPRVSDFATRWANREDNGQLRTSRQARRTS